MKTLNLYTGKLAEDLACDHLKKKGYLLVERNFRNRFGEIDIIAKNKDTLVFIEVKAKTGKDFGSPEEMINSKKLFKVRRMAEVYLNGKNSLCRIDVVAVVLGDNNNLIRLTHYENVY